MGSQPCRKHSSLRRDRSLVTKMPATKNTRSTSTEVGRGAGQQVRVCTERNVSYVTLDKWRLGILEGEPDTTCDLVTHGILAVFVHLSINITQKLKICVIPKSRYWDRLTQGFWDW